MAERYGSKGTAGLPQAIVSAMPAHSTYLETHPGGGAIMRRRPPARRSIGIDPDRRPADSFRCGYPVELHHGCAHRFLSGFDFDGRGLVYRDPPYVRSTRRGPRRHRFDCTDDDHVAPAGILGSLPCRVMVSGYPPALHDAHLNGWRPPEVQASSQACTVTGKLWSDLGPDRPHRRACAGRNLADRQRTRRNAAGRARRHRAMPPGGRLAVPAAVMAVEAGERARRPMSARPGIPSGTCPA